MSGISSYLDVCVCTCAKTYFEPTLCVCVCVCAWGDVMVSSLSLVICSVWGSVMSCRGRSGQALQTPSVEQQKHEIKKKDFTNQLYVEIEEED